METITRHHWTHGLEWRKGNWIVTLEQDGVNFSDQLAFPALFKGQANYLVGRYGAPVFLTGSALTSEHPRDIDIRIVLSDKEVSRLYGHDFPKRSETIGELLDWEWRRLRDNLRQSRSLSNWSGYPIDFQIQSEMEALAYKDCRRLRLDSAPSWVFLDTRFTNYDTNTMRELLGIATEPEITTEMLELSSD